ncbi:type IX secretion system membrane protein PorP/SprF [Fulvivirga sp. RKSG066]|nr:type IX secretion system membrane protein PorP/SprF [Fulvivirga aurantia]
MKRIVFVFVIIAIVFTEARAQDPHFSQYYSAPLYLNPAFAGTGNNHRLIANYRNQWPAIANGFVTYAFSYDYNVAEVRSGVGFLATVDKAGSADLTSTTLQFIYSYKVQLSDKWVVTPGLSFGYGMRDIDFNKLVFGDQLDFSDRGQAPTTDSQVMNNLGSANYFDFGAGILIYNKTFWAGFSASHINTPNKSLLDVESKVPMKKSLHAGVKIPLYNGVFKRDRVSSISPSFVYQNQGNFDQLDVGLHFNYSPVMIGAWYRGIPIQQDTKDNVSQDALVMILGMQFDNLEIGYSYDFTISDLSSVSGGAHEIALKYSVDVSLRRKVKHKDKFIPCPTFTK